MEIRFITSADNRCDISKVYEDSWKFAYKGIIPQSYLDSIPTGHWASNVDSPDWNTLVCVEDGKIVGTSSFGKSRFEQFAGWGEIISIYLLPDYMGRGYGKALLKTAVRELRKLGLHDIFLWVLEENNVARRFYDKMGFICAGNFGITFLEKYEPKPLNSMILFNRIGTERMHYSKVHTCAFDLEKVLSSGDNFYVTELDIGRDIIKVGSTICFDREFPESARILMLKGAEVILALNACPMEINRLSALRTRALRRALTLSRMY